MHAVSDKPSVFNPTLPLLQALTAAGVCRVFAGQRGFADHVFVRMTMAADHGQQIR
jgi:hypothetical protein